MKKILNTNINIHRTIFRANILIVFALAFTLGIGATMIFVPTHIFQKAITQLTIIDEKGQLYEAKLLDNEKTEKIKKEASIMNLANLLFGYNYTNVNTYTEYAQKMCLDNSVAILISERKKNGVYSYDVRNKVTNIVLGNELSKNLYINENNQFFTSFTNIKEPNGIAFSVKLSGELIKTVADNKYNSNAFSFINVKQIIRPYEQEK